MMINNLNGFQLESERTFSVLGIFISCQEKIVVELVNTPFFTNAMNAIMAV